MAKRKVGGAEISRLKVLAAGDERAFREYAAELLRSGERLAREAALAALLQRPVPALRPALRELYAELDADGLKRDQGAAMRSAIVQLLKEFGDVRDVDIAVRACEAREGLWSGDTLVEDLSWRLRVHGLRFLAEVDPELFPYIAAERINDFSGPDSSEPANTAIQLLGAMRQHSLVYYWLISGTRPPGTIAAVFELLADGRKDVAERYARTAIGIAIRSENDELATVLAETIVNAEMADLYPAIGELMSAKISEELYNYLAVLLAGTGRPALFSLLEHELRRGRRPKVVATALQVRPTSESEKILKRWEDGEIQEEDDE